MKINGKDYVIGQDLNEKNIVAHLYNGTFNDPGLPMCVRGWNRANGTSYSMTTFRNAPTGPICLVCLKRAKSGKDGIRSRKRKTKYL